MLTEQETVSIAYRKIKADGIEIFYREAGPKDAKTIVLLHAFPISSHMFRDLIPLLAHEYHVIAPDMPDFGYSDQPATGDFQYTFEHITNVMDHALTRIASEPLLSRTGTLTKKA